MINTREYISSLTLSYSDIENLEKCQRQIYSKGFIEKNQSSLASALGPVATILGVVAFIPNLSAIGVASAIMAVVSGLTSPAQESSLKTLLEKGYMQLGLLKDEMFKGNWQMVKIDAPFLECTDQGIRFVSGAPSMQAYYQDGVWVS